MNLELTHFNHTHLAHNPDWRGRTFLVVEDTHSNIALINTFLSRTGARLIHASNGLEAVKAVQNNPSIELVLMDIRLPVMNGFSATRLIKKLRPDLPVLAQTAYAMVSDHQTCFDAGCDGFLAKPYKKNDLITMVDNLLRNHLTNIP